LLDWVVFVGEVPWHVNTTGYSARRWVSKKLLRRWRRSDANLTKP